MAKKPDCTELQATIAQIALNYARREGVNNLDDVVKKVQGHFPALTRQDISDSIVAFTANTHKRTVNDVAQKLRDIKTEARVDAALRERIDSLKKEIESGQFTRKGTVQPKKATDAIDALRQAREKLTKEADLRRRIAELDQKIQSGDTSRQTRTPKEVPDDLKPLVEQRAELQRELDLHRQIADMTGQLESGEIAREAKRKAISNERIERLALERDRLRRQINDRIQAMAPRTKFERYFLEPFGLVRAFKTSFDLSAVGRQGAFIVFGNPVRAAKNLGPMLRAFASERASINSQREIESRPNAPLYERAKLYLTPVETTPTLTRLEEAYMSRWARKIPGIKQSERAYVTFLNRLRADSFDAMTDALGRSGQVTEQEAQAIANFINIATGRGNVGGLEKASAAINTVFFSPRLMASRFQLLAGSPMWGGTARTRKLIAKEYAKFLTGFGVALFLLSLGADDIELDPRSSDFLKARFGETRIDLGAGLLQPLVLMSRIISGGKKTIGGRVVPIRDNFRFGVSGEVPYRGDTAMTLAGRFLRTKFSPTLAIPTNIIDTENVIGQPVTPGSIAADLVIPMSFMDIYQAMREEGVPKGMALSTLAIFGVGMQTHEEREPSSGRSLSPSQLYQRPDPYADLRKAQQRQR